MPAFTMQGGKHCPPSKNPSPGGTAAGSNGSGTQGMAARAGSEPATIHEAPCSKPKPSVTPCASASVASLAQGAKHSPPRKKPSPSGGIGASGREGGVQGTPAAAVEPGTTHEAAASNPNPSPSGSVSTPVQSGTHCM